jgi:hypothetical protein
MNSNTNRKLPLKHILLLVLLLINILSFSQKTVRSKGFSKVKQEANRTKEQTKAEVKQQAMINAIENKFGTYVTGGGKLIVKDGKSAFSYIGTTKVKGEWIKTLDIYFEEDSQQTKSGIDIYISCHIDGRIREATPKANINFEVLNDTSIKSRTKSFYNNEQLYIHFISPVDGYVSVFIEEGETTRRLLPYSGMEGEYQSGVPVKGDQAYIFFSEDFNYFPAYVMDEMLLYTNIKKEYNTVYIVFSEEKFVKPILKSVETINDRLLPKSIRSIKFKEWLSDCKASIPGFLDVEIEITIEKR